jgi:hypothetical protein
MPDALLLAAALVCTVLGMGWLALAMDVHWKQVRAASQSPRTVMWLRLLGVSSLLGSLVLCLAADTATMAVLVWMMLLAVSATTIAFVLSSQPRMLAPLVAWSARR